MKLKTKELINKFNRGGNSTLIIERSNLQLVASAFTKTTKQLDQSLFTTSFTKNLMTKIFPMQQLKNSILQPSTFNL